MTFENIIITICGATLSVFLYVFTVNLYVVVILEVILVVPDTQAFAHEKRAKMLSEVDVLIRFAHSSNYVSICWGFRDQIGERIILTR